MLRNTGVTNDYGAAAADIGTHTQHYALRPPQGLGTPASGAPLQEALRFQTPMIARPIVPAPLANKWPESYSFASMTAPAIITAAKAAEDGSPDVIIRVNASDAIVQTALEGKVNPALQPVNATIASSSQSVVELQMNHALATVRLNGALAG